MAIEDRYTRYGIEDLTLHLYEYPVTINDDYTVTGTRATDGDGDNIVGVDEGDGQYSFSGVEYGTYCVVAYKPGLLPQIVNGWQRFVILPKLGGDEIAGSEDDSRTLKTIINSVITYILANDDGWTGTPPTLIA
jgi:hypothetical protein